MPGTVEPSSPPAPPGWPRAARPLTIAILGWARLSFQAREGSGYNLNASELAAGLALSGHRVSYLRSGMDYSLLGRPHTRPAEVWRGVACHDLFNSRNLSPASSNFRNMTAEMSSPAETRVVLDWLEAIGAQVVHIHSLEGYGLDLIGAIRDRGIPVVVTPHNYWYVCPQVDLLHEESRVCEDYRGGARCVGCLHASEPGRARSRRAIEQTMHRLVGPFWAHTLRQVYTHTKATLRSLVVRRRARGSPPALAPSDPELALGFDVRDGSRHSGRVYHALPAGHEPPPGLGVSPIDQNERFLAATHHLEVLNEYGRRRTAGVECLNRASLVTPPSEFLLDVMRTMGVAGARLRHVRLGQPHFDQINRRTRRSPFYDARPWDPSSSRPLRFGFLGTTRNNKGLDVLVRAISMLDKAARQRCHFLIRAAGHDWPFRRRLASFPEVSFGGGYDTVSLIPLMDEFDVGILPHVWFENSPLVLLEFLHAGKFVISSRLGGPPEWIVEPRDGRTGNGLLFPGGDPAELAQRITRVVRGEITLPSPREVHSVSTLRSYPEHVAEFETIYRGLVDGPAPPIVTVNGSARLVRTPSPARSA